MLCMYVSVFPAKTAERPCPENLISGLQSASSNKGFLQGGGTVYLSFYLFISLETVFFFFPLSKQHDATNAGRVSTSGFSGRGIVLHNLLQTLEWNANFSQST